MGLEEEGWPHARLLLPVKARDAENRARAGLQGEPEDGAGQRADEGHLEEKNLQQGIIAKKTSATRRELEDRHIGSAVLQLCSEDLPLLADRQRLLKKDDPSTNDDRGGVCDCNSKERANLISGRYGGRVFPPWEGRDSSGIEAASRVPRKSTPESAPGGARKWIRAGPGGIREGFAGESHETVEVSAIEPTEQPQEANTESMSKKRKLESPTAVEEPNVPCLIKIR